MDQPLPASSATPLAESSDNRRGFGVRLAAILCGGIAAVFPFAAGLAVFFDPLRRKRGSADTNGGFLRVAAFDSLPADGTPTRIPIVTDRVDAWNVYPHEPVGMIYLRRTEQGQPQAFSATCPHAGCLVTFIDSRKEYFCPCHNSVFRADGSIASGPSPRPLDSLETKLQATGQREEVLVRYQDFVAGTAEKTVKA